MQLQTFSIFLHEYYKNIQIISETEPECFLTEEIREKLVNNMNYTVEQLNGENVYGYSFIVLGLEVQDKGYEGGKLLTEIHYGKCD
jgi:hypothetical protein